MRFLRKSLRCCPLLVAFGTTGCAGKGDLAPTDSYPFNTPVGTTPNPSTTSGTSVTSPSPTSPTTSEQTRFTYEGIDTLLMDVQASASGEDEKLAEDICTGDMRIIIDRVNGTDYEWNWPDEKGDEGSKGEPTGHELVGVGDCVFASTLDSAGEVLWGRGQLLGDFVDDTHIVGELSLIIGESDADLTSIEWTGSRSGDTVSGSFSGSLPYDLQGVAVDLVYDAAFTADRID